jgi:hypothetical protein
MDQAIKYVIKTDNNRTYSLHIINAIEYQNGKYVGLFLYQDVDNYATERGEGLRHRLLFENSIDAIKDKVLEYTSGRGENIVFVEKPTLAA